LDQDNSESICCVFDIWNRKPKIKESSTCCYYTSSISPFSFPLLNLLFLLYLSWSIVGDPSWPYSLFWSTSSDHRASILLPWEKWNKAQRNKFPRTTWSSHLKCLKPYFKNWNEHSKMRSCDTLYPERQLRHNTKIKKKKPKWKIEKKGRLGHHHYHHWLIWNHITTWFLCSLFFKTLSLYYFEKKNTCKLSSMHITWSKKCCVFFNPNCTSYAEDTLPSKSCYYLRKKLESPFFLLLSNFLYRYTPKGVSFWILRKTLKIVFIALIGKNTAFFPWNPNPPTFLSWNPICDPLSS
jgi:hypothetical protein